MPAPTIPLNVSINAVMVGLVMPATTFGTRRFRKAPKNTRHGKKWDIAVRRRWEVWSRCRDRTVQRSIVKNPEWQRYAKNWPTQASMGSNEGQGPESALRGRRQTRHVLRGCRVKNFQLKESFTRIDDDSQRGWRCVAFSFRAGFDI
jgi:hypothetical protein